MHQVAVRCGSDPRKILGWFLLELAWGYRLEEGQRLEFELLGPGNMLDGFWYGVRALYLPLEVYVDDAGVEHLAFRVDDQIPYAELRRAHGFVPAH